MNQLHYKIDGYLMLFIYYFCVMYTKVALNEIMVCLSMAYYQKFYAPKLGQPIFCTSCSLCILQRINIDPMITFSSDLLSHHDLMETFIIFLLLLKMPVKIVHLLTGDKRFRSMFYIPFEAWVAIS